MSEKNICPGCGRHCDLNEPHCGRGEEYCRTGKMPEGQHGKEHRHEPHEARFEEADMNDRLLSNLRDLGHMMRFLHEGKAGQKRILIMLYEAQKMTQRDLTERLEIQPGSASEILSKLEGAGLISRTPNEVDRRTTDVCLTDAGRELAAETLAQRQRRHEEMFSCLTEEEREKLLSLLERVRADWKSRYRESGNACGHGRHHGGHHREEGHRDGHGHHGEGGYSDDHGHRGGRGYHGIS